MEERLIIRLQEGSDQIEWLLQKAQGVTDAPKVGTFADINLPNFKGKVILLVPTTLVYMTKGKLPKLSEAKLRKAVPYVVEDELASEIEACHFAYYKQGHDNKSVIAVVERKQMDAWLAQIPPELKSQTAAMVPDVLALPVETNRWSIANFGKIALVRTNTITGFAVDKEILPTVLAQQLQEANKQPPEEIVVIQPKNADDLASALANRVTVPITTQNISESELNFFAKNLPRVPPLNLLQGDYRANVQAHNIEKIQRAVILLAAGWFALLSLFGVTKYAITRYQGNELAKQVAVEYKEIFPLASATESPRQRVETALAAVKKAKQQGNFLRLLSQVSPALVGKPGVEVQGFIYNKNQVDIQLTVSDFQMLDKITTDLRDAGLQVEQSRANKVGDVIQSHLIIKEV